MQLEGIIVKRPDAPYVSARSETWLKLKCSLRQEFVVCGFTDRANAAAEVGSLLLGYHEGKVLKYAGNVGTGWNARTGHDLFARLKKLEVDAPLFDAATIQPGRWSRRTAGGERWVKPELVAEVAFREWTPDGHVRHAVYQGLRLDKTARSVTREVAADVAAAPAAGDIPRAAAPSTVERQSQQPGSRHRPGERPHQARPRALLRERRRAHPAASRRPAGLAGARARRHHRRAVLPEASRDAHARAARARHGALAEPRGAARGRHAPTRWSRRRR